MKRFINAFNKAITHNEKNDKKKSFKITYKKLNGRTVKRKIDPVSMKNNVVVAFDHKRQALRSFKVERLKGMEKAAFLNIFKKKDKDSEERKPSTLHVNYLHSHGLSDDEFNDLNKSVKHIGEVRKQIFSAKGVKPGSLRLGGSSNWRDDAIAHFLEKHPSAKGKVFSGNYVASEGENVNGQGVYVTKLENLGDEKPYIHAHVHHVGDEKEVENLHPLKGSNFVSYNSYKLASLKKERIKDMEKAAFWNGFEKQAVGEGLIRKAYTKALSQAALLRKQNPAPLSKIKKLEAQATYFGNKLDQALKPTTAKGKAKTKYLADARNKEREALKTIHGYTSIPSQHLKVGKELTTKTRNALPDIGQEKSAVKKENFLMDTALPIGTGILIGATGHNLYKKYKNKNIKKEALDKSHLYAGGAGALAGLAGGGYLGHKMGRKKGQKDVVDFLQKVQQQNEEAQKQAGLSDHLTHGAELAGLGILAAPAVKHMVTGKEMSEKGKNVSELAGLGVLAAPSIHHFLKNKAPLTRIVK